MSGCDVVRWAGDIFVLEYTAASGFFVSGRMTAVEKECRDAQAAADPSNVTWTAARFTRIPLLKARR